MKKHFYLLAFAGLFACKNDNTEKKFIVEGSVKNTTSKLIYLEENVPGAGPTIMDSSEIKANGSFTLKAPTKEESLYQLRLQDKLVPFSFIISDGPSVNVQADLNNAAQPYTIEGSTATQQLLDFDKGNYTKGMELFVQASKVDSMQKAGMPDSIVKAEYEKAATIGSAMKQSAEAALASSKSPVFTLYALSSYENAVSNVGIGGFSQPEKSAIILAAAEKFPTHQGLQAIKKTLPSSKAPEFSQPGPDGKPISLSSFKGKYVLLDFWASWCRPCRMDNPNVVKAYTEFKDKNFTVFGVSLDQDRDAWLQAIQQDGLTWPHASDLKFWSNDAAVLYGVQSIPANFLLDPQGNIIAQDLHGEEIVRVLRKVVK